MINTNMRTYNYYTYGAPNAYGQPELSATVQGAIKLAIYTTSQAIQNNINYRDCSYIGLTHSKEINDTFVIDYNGEKIKVLYVTPGNKLKMVFFAKI